MPGAAQRWGQRGAVPGGSGVDTARVDAVVTVQLEQVQLRLQWMPALQCHGCGPEQRTAPPTHPCASSERPPPLSASQAQEEVPASDPENHRYLVMPL